MFMRTLLSIVSFAALVGGPFAAPAIAAPSDEGVVELATHAVRVDATVRRLAGRADVLRERRALLVSGVSWTAWSARVPERWLPAVDAVLAGLDRRDRGGALTARLEALEGRRLDRTVHEIEIEERLAVALTAGRFGRWPSDVQRWRPLVARAFPPSLVEDAMAVLACESGGDPKVRSRRSSATGLFQFLRGTWRWVASEAGLGDSDPRDPEANVAAAAWLVRNSIASGHDPWAHWSCKP